MKNARCANGSLRRKNRQRIKSLGLPCGICRGALGDIHYNEPSDSAHPLSFVIDEIIPISRWKEFGYPSARAAAEDFSNLQAAHYYCNALKSNKINFHISAENMKKNNFDVPTTKTINKINVIDGDW